MDATAQRSCYRAVIEYDGTDFLGYQFQKVGRTVQGEIERSLKKVTQSEVRIKGAGRTDAGVHATGQVIAFKTAWNHTLGDLHRALNATVPKDIVIRNLEIAERNFHPRFDAISRSYCYTIINQPWPAVLQRRYTHHIKKELDVEAMERAGSYLLGSHDFASFGKPPQGKNTVRRVMQIGWPTSAKQVVFRITANAFLYQMVRRIVGTLIEVGLGRLRINAVKEILESRDLARSANPAPPQGLCLVKVTYPGDEDA